MFTGGAGNLIGVRQVADRLGISTSTVYALCDRGELLHIRILNAIRVAPADLEAFLVTGRTPPDSSNVGQQGARRGHRRGLGGRR